jgi:hypothetical protein
LRDCAAARGLHGGHACDAVFTHAGHQHCGGLLAELLRDGLEQNVGGRAVSVDARLVHKNRDVAVLHAPDFDMAIARADQRAAGEKQITGLRLFHFDRGGFIEPPREHFGEALRHVLHHDEAAGKIMRKLRENVLKRVGAAGGNADGNHARRIVRHANAPVFFGPRRRHGDDHFRSAGCSGGSNFLSEFSGDVIDAAGGSFLRLGDEVECAESKRFESDGSAAFGLAADDDDGNVMPAGDLAQHLDAVHARHVEIERNDVGTELGDLFQAERAVHGGADDFDRRIALKNLRDQLAHQGRIVNDEDAEFGVEWH